MKYRFKTLTKMRNIQTLKKRGLKERNEIPRETLQPAFSLII